MGDIETTEKQIPKGVLDKIIENLIEERVFCIQGSMESADRDKETEAKLISLSNNIRDKMGADWNLFMMYEELSTINENVSLRDTYRKGFLDGISFLRGICLKA